MTALKKQAVSMIYEIPNEQMDHVIELLEMLGKVFANTETYNIQTVAKTSRLKTWKEFKKYKGIVSNNLNEKAELAKARDEKYADFIGH